MQKKCSTCHNDAILKIIFARNMIFVPFKENISASLRRLREYGTRSIELYPCYNVEDIECFDASSDENKSLYLVFMCRVVQHLELLLEQIGQ
jgi:hypothetical protein